MIVHNEGADLHVDVEGSGPTLLLIPGAGGSGARFAGLAGQLADRYTVVRYDRRANGRSGGERDAPFDMAQQARDAAAVARAFPQPVQVFATSGGAVIALALAAELPGTVAGMVLHEVPLIGLLPDAAEQKRDQALIAEAARSQGIGAALRMFMATLVGVRRNSDPPPPELIASFSRFFLFEFAKIGAFEPDIDRIIKASTQIALLVGRESADAYYVRATQALGRQLGVDVQIVSGHHLSFAESPQELAVSIATILGTSNEATRL